MCNREAGGIAEGLVGLELRPGKGWVTPGTGGQRVRYVAGAMILSGIRRGSGIMPR